MPLCVLASLLLHAGLFAAGAYVAVDAAGGMGGGGQGGDEPASFTIHVRARGPEASPEAADASPSTSLIAPEDPNEAPTIPSVAQPPEMSPAAPLEKPPEVALAEVAPSPPSFPSLDEPPKSPVRGETNQAGIVEAGIAAHLAPSLGSGGGAGSGQGEGSGIHSGKGNDLPGPAARSSPAVLLFDPKPDYPPVAIRRGQEGSVLCAMRVGDDGRVEDVEILRSSGHPVLDRSASAALHRWIFEPAREDGRAVPSRVLHQVAFKLD
jgi:protein TonB